MNKILLLIALSIMSFSNSLKSELINQPVVNMYRQPEEPSSVNSQAIYGSSVKIIEWSADWLKIKTLDGVEGWVKSSQIINNLSFEQNNGLRPVKNLFAHVYQESDIKSFPPLLTLPYGSKVKLVDVKDKRWLQIELVSGEKAWIQSGDIDFAPRLKTLEEVIVFSKKFIGLPYTWGGTSSYGFDCSGFIQMLFKEMGFLIPRNSRYQAESKLFISISQDDLQAGDLIFFGESRINHVGLYLGNGEFIHSGVTESPMIMISYLQSGKYHFNTARRIVPERLNHDVCDTDLIYFLVENLKEHGKREE